VTGYLLARLGESDLCTGFRRRGLAAAPAIIRHNSWAARHFVALPTPSASGEMLA